MVDNFIVGAGVSVSIGVGVGGGVTDVSGDPVHDIAKISRAMAEKVTNLIIFIFLIPSFPESLISTPPIIKALLLIEYVDYTTFYRQVINKDTERHFTAL